jgi:protein-tyrosine-phosphatase
MAKKTNILFVCKYNRFRSKIAEDYFNKINKNSNLKAKSAGVFEGSKIDAFQRRIAKKLGIKIKGTPQGISTKLLKWQNFIVIVANDIPEELFKENKRYGKGLLIWKIPDAKEDSKDEVERIVKDIKKNVEQLARELK